MGQRKSLLESVQVGKPDGSDQERFRRRVERWKGLAQGFLPEIYALGGATDPINHATLMASRFFFRLCPKDLTRQALMDKTVDIYNDSVPGDIERLDSLLWLSVASPTPR